MSINKIRVLLVDDSGFMRLVVSDMINSSDDFFVIDTATNGLEAVEKTMLLNPDVVVLDLTMKEYDGLYAVKHIMQSKPTPIVILSALGNTQPEVVFEALDNGACDFITKPDGLVGSRVREVQHDLLHKLKSAFNADKSNLGKKTTQKYNLAHQFDTTLYDMVVMGASTGGTGAIESILTKLPSNLPIPIIIAQHMTEGFIFSFAERLAGTVNFPVKVATLGETPRPGSVYLLPCDANMELRKKGNRVSFQTTDKQFKEYNCPSVDCLFLSAAEVYGSRLASVLLTGMGKDGAQGSKAIFDKGGYTITQDEASSVVFGMPKAAIELGASRKTLSVHQIPSFLVSMLG
jgi:two-component system, chemotaxis family, protein-glutamate methylesterase/glutaminase